MIRKLGFAEKWVRLIMSLVKSVELALVINGKPGSYFKPTRGICQGGPLSPYLFLFIGGWKQGLLSQPGKDILIKSVAQVVPTYLMGIFKFPKSLCKKQDEIKVHWISWATLGLPKNQGGMGFKDFNDFNLALPAKQCWRLIMKPNSQWPQPLKARYFSECSFLEAKKGGRASWAWASLLEGRKIILQGARWQILNGRQAKLWTDCWIPSLHDGKLHPHLKTSVDPNIRVEILIDWDSKTWNLTPIEASITDEEKLAIELIPIRNGREDDRLVWHGEKNGKFSVRSGYHCICDLQVETTARKASTSSWIDPLVWKNIRKAEVPPKMKKNFLWRVTHGRLLTAMALHKRKIARTPLCPICQAHEESIEHLLLFCPWVELIWFGGLLNYKIDK
ncbi:hypothetical protein PRUPE_6G353900 [Prunus persica]|uniref:Reverse transcriptase zinc-binding domain-containing protein n=1 Tax=Prunus persica TaxID=3760 RepID=A0A251P0D8_PRUPE|nr:hypothetical protein PRUPE_6G353900 [Prunus persica]